MFVGRKEELKKLDDMYHSDEFEFAVFYGRRVGKTTLINKFGKDKKMIYFMAVESSAKENLNDFSKVIWEVIQPDVEMPEYLSRINLKCGVDENIIHLFFDRTGRMFEEPGNLLKQELRSPGVYNAVIQGIAAGCSRLNEIATRAGVDNSTCANQITTLVKLGLVKKEIPITENENSRKTIYRLADSMFSFWYRFVMPNISSIEKGMGRQVYEKKVKPHLNDFMGMIFETICLQYMYQKDIFQEAPFFYGNMGRWWGNNSKEKRQEKIDLLAFDEQSILLGECKWKNQELGNNVVEDLIRKGDLFYQPNKWFYFFSKSGFSKQVQEKAIENKQIQLIGFAQMNEC